MTSSTEVCPTCHNLEFEDGQMADLDIYTLDLLETGEEGCLGCNLLIDALNCWSPTYLRDFGTEDHYFSVMVDDAAMWVTLPPQEDDDDGCHIQILWQLDDPNRQFYADIIPGSLAVMAHSGTTAAFDRVKSWLDHCCRNHTDCRPQPDRPFHPKRLIAINPIKRKDIVRVVEFPAEHCERAVTYAALSYCWGADLTGVVKTTKQNLAKHRRGIPVSMLPASIADAIAVCRGIKIPYLWVDSLCIVQDDDDDWRRESSRMDAIYINSHVTIAAHRAASCRDGFLGEQRDGQPDRQRSFTTRFWPPGTRTLDADEEPDLTKMILRTASSSTSPDTTEGDPPYSALMRRGWTLQEGLLPQRLIHYTGDEMAWECLGKRVCECGHVTNNKRGTPLLRSRIIRGLGSEDSFPGYQWMQLVENYTTRQLTRSSDKLVALSGLAKFFSACARASVQTLDTDLPYLAGIYFPDDAVRQLLWGVKSCAINTNQKTPPSPRHPYCAPTWSWASIDRPVVFPSYPVRSHITVHSEETFCEPLLADDPTGAVTGGQLVVSGEVIPAMLMTIEPPLRESNYSWMPSDLWSGRLTLVRGLHGCMHPVSCDIVRPIQLRRADPGYRCWTRQDHLCAKCCPSEQDWESTQYVCLKVATEDTGGPKTHFLVLQRSDGEDAWERVGLGTITENRDGRKVDREQELRWLGSKTARDLFEGPKVQKIRIV